MKTRVVTIVILLLILTVLLTRNNERISNTLLHFINPLKQNYRALTQEIEDTSQSYIFQQQSIERLKKENVLLHKLLLDQAHYLQQLQSIYDVLPSLEKSPIKSIAISETISYVKLNSFSQIILTQPQGLVSKKLYGLIQGNVVGGVAEVKNNQLYGYLTSDKKCRFGVFIGKKNAPGIAIGESTHEMVVKFIPKWYEIKEGDSVVTSGLDNIFFTQVPVGIVTKVTIQSSYKVAYIKSYNDVLHPKTFFLISDAKNTLATYYDANKTKKPPLEVHSIPTMENNQTQEENLSTIIAKKPLLRESHQIDQTQVDLVEPRVPLERHLSKKVKPRKKPSTKKRKKVERFDTLDLF